MTYLLLFENPKDELFQSTPLSFALSIMILTLAAFQWGEHTNQAWNISEKSQVYPQF